MNTYNAGGAAIGTAALAAPVVVVICTGGGCEAAAPLVAEGAAATISTGTAVGGLVSAGASALNGGSTGKVVMDALKGIVGSAITSAAGILAGPAKVPQAGAEGIAAAAYTRAQGGSLGDTVISGAITAGVGLATNNPGAAGAASSLVRILIKKTVTTEAKTAAQKACSHASWNSSC